MPYYDYKCDGCDSTFEVRKSYEQRHEPANDACPNCGSSGQISLMPSAASIGDPIRLGVKRPDAGFTEVMNRIKHNHPHHKMKQSFGGTAIV